MQRYPEIFSLQGKVAVITGAAGGLGAMIARGFSEAGASVVIGDIDTNGLKLTASEIEAEGGSVRFAECDVRDAEQARRLVSLAIEAFGQLDVLVNNAGIGDPDASQVHETSVESWNKVIDINLHGTFNCSRPALDHMLSRGSGKIINIASMWGLAGTSSVFPAPAYAASKGAIVNLTREMALEYAPKGINVNAICPGFYGTNLGPFDDPEFVAQINTFTPQGRFADADEIKGPAIFLASAASNFVNGLMLVADGGCLAK